MAAGGVLVGRGYVSIRPEFEGDWSRQVNARASSAGRSGGGAFGKAFGTALSGGMRGIVAGLGPALIAGIAPAGAAAAALAPALATAGAAAGALKLGLSGVGEAFKAAFADTGAQASQAASATRAVESAQRGLANAQRGLALARVDAARRVQDAQRQVADAERDLADAQRDARDVQADLNDARREAARALQDMNQRLAESRLDEREAVLRLQEAEKELKAAQQKPGTDPAELERLELSYERAKLNLQEQRTETKRLATDTAAANKAGVEGSEQVVAARQRISEANQTVADRERALADAQAGVAQAREDGARQVEDAQRQVADAAQAVADAQAAAAAQTSAVDQALAKLSPNARSFVGAVQELAPAWNSMRKSVQDALFSGLDSTVTTLGRSTIPVLRDQLTQTAGIWNQMAKSAAGAVTEMARTGMLEDILRGANDNLRAFKDTPGQLVTAWGQLSVAAQPAFNRMAQGFAGAIAGATAGLGQAFESGALRESIDTAFSILGQLAGIAADAFAVVGNVLKAASDAGAGALSVVGELFEELRRITAMPEVQTALRTIFASIAQIAAALAPIIGAALQAILPLLAAVAPVFAELATALGPVVTTLVQAFGTILQPIVEALMPLVALLGDALIQMVSALTPLLAPLGQLVTLFVNALMPIMTPLVELFSQLVDALAGPLTQVIEGFVPVFELLGQLIADVFGALEPLIGPLVAFASELAAILVGALTGAIQALMTAIEPLIPVFVTLIEEVVGALLPVMPALTEAFAAIAAAALALFTPLAEIASQLATALAPVIGDIVPIITELAVIFAGVLAQALPPLTDALVILIEAFAPILPLVVDLAAQLLVQLLPSLLQLIQAGIGLALALVPILPPLAEIVGLVLELAINVLSWLLPPLIDFAGFLVGGLASSLSTAIGWVSGLVTVISTLVTWVVDHLGPAFKWLNEKVVQPVWKAIKTAVQVAWDYGLKPLFGFIEDGIGGMGGMFRWLNDKVVQPVWEGIKSTISGVWKYGIKPIFKALTDAVDAVADSFEAARKAIKTAWDKLEGIALDPVQFIIDVVYNNGILKVWNLVVDAFGGDELDPMVFKYARGGVLPGYTPGRDVHTFVSPTGGALQLSGGEAVMRPEWTRAVGSGYVNAMNAAARSGGVAGVRSMLGFKDGGILEGIGDVVGGAWDKVKAGASWLKDTFSGALRAGVEHVVNPLIDKIPGGQIGFVGLLKSLMKDSVRRMLGIGKEADKKITPHVRYSPTRGVEQWRPVVLQSLREVGQSSGHANRTLRRMQQESGGNPTIVNKWDSNWQAGHPSVGLMQVIGPTFRSHAGKYRNKGPFSYGVSVDPLANIYSSMRYALSTYGSLPRAYDRAGGYDSGGWLQPGVTTAVNLTGKPEAVLTAGQWRTMQAAAAGGSLDGMTVNVWVGNEQIRDITRAEVRDSQQQLVRVLNAS
ncbi:transglycosylase SLT domain-containing protein [Streptomyces sp. MN13]